MVTIRCAGYSCCVVYSYNTVFSTNVLLCLHLCYCLYFGDDEIHISVKKEMLMQIYNNEILILLHGITGRSAV